MDKKVYLRVNSVNSDFYSYIEEMREIHRDENGYKVTKKQLAKITHIPYEMLKKVICSYKTTNRDYILAICIALKMNIYETNKALELYQMCRLNTRNIRDSIIVNMINKKADIEGVNDALEEGRCSYLSIGELKGKNETRVCEKKERLLDMNFSVKKHKYNVLEQEIIMPYDFLSFIYDTTLSSMYDPEKFSCAGSTIIEDTITKKKYRIELDGVTEIYEIVGTKEILKDCYFRKNECNDEELLEIILNMECVINTKEAQLIHMANDTKNYQQRASAGIVKDKLYMYIEMFNYKMPEINEYYMLEVKDGKEKFSVWDKSIFMSKYITKDKYLKLYGENEARCIAVYNSVEELEIELDNSLKGISRCLKLNQYIIKVRMEYFKEMQKNLYDLKKKLQNRELVIYSSSDFDEGEIVEVFRLIDEFDGVDNEHGGYVLKKKEYIDRYGNKIQLNDLYRAFELGIVSNEELGRILNDKGSLELLLD